MREIALAAPGINFIFEASVTKFPNTFIVPSRSKKMAFCGFLRDLAEITPFLQSFAILS